jgi:Uma2 family endonuclease
MTILTPRKRRVQYPESDGKPLGETDLHRRLMTDLIFTLKWYLRDTLAYVAGNLFVYYQEGNPKAVVAPDVFVVLGAEQRERRVYQVWREDGKRPDVVIELTSKATRKADEELKPALYASLGVREYFLYDPYGEWLRPRLQGYRLVNGTYQSIVGLPIHSTVLGLDLRVDDDALRCYDPRTHKRLSTPDEEVLARADAEARAAEEAARAAEEAARAAEEAARAAGEAARANAAEAELVQLRAELERLRAERS